MDSQQSRKWLLTLNNPEKHGYDQKRLIQQTSLLSFEYLCMCYEVGETGTRHIHIFIYSKSPIRFQRIKNIIPEAHIEVARGNVQENRDYITKSGKWENDKKSETNLRETFYEIGELPKERAAQEDKNEKLYEMIENGMSTIEIIESDKNYIYKVKQIEEIRQLYLDHKFSEQNRNLEVIYVYGDTGTGKTFGIQRKHGSKNICRITSYNRGGNGVYFDSYKSEPVLVFEEYSGQIPIEDMLNYLDIYPIKLPARYADKVACYSTVYITSNMALEDQYKGIQYVKPKTWEAFLRRISKVIEYRSNGEVVETIMKGKMKYGKRKKKTS